MSKISQEGKDFMMALAKCVIAKEAEASEMGTQLPASFYSYFGVELWFSATNVKSILDDLANHASIVAELQEQVQKLAAENSRYDAIAADLVCLPDEDINGITKSVRNILNRLAFEYSSATDTNAVIREIGAKAVEGFGDVLGLGSLHLSLILKKCAYEHAAKLRAGEQP